MTDNDVIKKGFIERWIELWNTQYEKHLGKFQDTPLLKFVLDCIVFAVVGGLGLIVLTVIWAIMSLILSGFNVKNGQSIALFLLIALVLIFIIAAIIKKFKRNRRIE